MNLLISLTKTLDSQSVNLNMSSVNPCVSYRQGVPSAPVFRLADLGQHVGKSVADIHMYRDKGFKREVRLLRMLMFITTSVWKVLLCAFYLRFQEEVI